MNAPKQAAPCGTWPSPITAEVVAAGSTPLSQLAVRGGDIFWLAGRASEAGRTTLLRHRGGATRELTLAPFNVRTRVHEYGGGAVHVAADAVYFSHFADNALYVVRGDDAPVRVAGREQLRFADFVLDAPRARLVSVCEDHAGGGYPVNTIGAVDLATGAVSTLVSGNDFYSSPRVSPDGRRLAWLCWDLPRMPWEGTELWVAEIGADGALLAPHRVAGGPSESVCQPEWSPAGELHFVSDRGGWWNLFRLHGGGVEPVCERAAEFAVPHWVFGVAMYGFLPNGDIACTYIENGSSRLALLAGGKLAAIANPYEEIRELRVAEGRVVLLAGGPQIPLELATIDLASGAHTVLERSIPALPDARYLSVPEKISYPTGEHAIAHGFFYPPCNAEYEPQGKPPLIVIIHGGPTGMATNTLKLATQYWTSRGFAVLDVNYRGSTGFGRAYRDALKGQWGVADVEDCVAGARYLAARGLVDAERLIIRGGSAGGFTTLSALAFHDVFKMGACYYGVSDLKGLDADSHKFESRYNQYLIAPPPEEDALYLLRSPIHHAAQLRRPMIFFQGLDDKVVPPQQSEVMVDALRANGVPVAYMTLEGEGHGFRKAASIVATLEAELYFYLRMWGLAGGPAPVTIENLPGAA
ncbi:MAG: S9 family peptidase [Telluria sp.]